MKIFLFKKMQGIDQLDASIFFIAIIALILFFIAGFISIEFYKLNNILTILRLATFFVVVGLGQGFVIMTGGIDLSVPWGMTTAGIILTTFSMGNNDTLIWVVPLALFSGALLGLFNGIGVAYLSVAPLIMTMATNVIIRGLILVVVNGTPRGLTPARITEMMSGDFLFGISPIFIIVIFLVIISTLVFTRTTYGRRLFAIGNSIQAAYLSGIDVKFHLLSVYVISGFLSALGGIMLTGYSTLAFVNMGDPYLLPSIATVVVGGAAIVGGRGKPIGTVLGAILLTILSTLLTALLLPAAIRNIIYGLVILIAVFFSRQSKNSTYA